MAKNRSHVNRKASSSSVLTSNISQLEPRGFGLPEGNAASTQSSGLDLSTVPMTATGTPVQAKLTVGQPGDKYEQEADAVAAQVVDRINSPQPHHSQPGTVQRQEIPEEEEIQQKPLGESIQRQEIPEEEEEIQAKPLAESIQRQEMLEEEEEMLQQKPLAESIQRQEMPEEEEELAQMKPELQREVMPEEDEENLQTKTLIQAKASGGAAASQSVEATISGARGQGQALSDETRDQMEGAFGADFGGVRVHTDTRSDQLNQSLQARAFTTGQDIFFKRGEFNPGSRGGQELLAHELTHVVQQNTSESQVQRLCGVDESCLEEETPPQERTSQAGMTSPHAPMSTSAPSSEISTRQSQESSVGTVDHIRSTSEHAIRTTLRETALRDVYKRGDAAIRAEAQAMVRAGQSEAAATRWAVQARNQLRQTIRDQGEPIIEVIAKARRGAKDMPTYESLRASGKTDAQIIESAGRSNVKFDRWVGRIRIAGRIAIAVDIGMGVYNIATAPEVDRPRVLVRELGRAGGALGGGWAGAKVGGTIGSFGGPIGTGVGAFLGGLGGALLGGWAGSETAEWAIEEFYPPNETRFEGSHQ